MSEYNIEDIKLGDHYIVKAYKGDDLIFDRNQEEYIQCTVNYTGHTDVGYIPVADVELYADYRYEVDVEFGSQAATLATLIGGSNTDAGGYGKGYSPGFFLGSFSVGTALWSEKQGVALLQNDKLGWPWPPPGIYRLDSCIWPFPHEEGSDPVFPQRHVISFQAQNMPSDEPWQVSSLSGRDRMRMTTGGFYLLGGRCGIDNPVSAYDTGYTGISSFYGDFGKVYRISIYDTDGTTLLMNFIPKAQNDHLGMIDTVSRTFYPVNDDSLFRISK